MVCLMIMNIFIIVVVVVPNGLVCRLWVKHKFSNKHKYIAQHYTFEQPMLQKSHQKQAPIKNTKFKQNHGNKH